MTVKRFDKGVSNVAATSTLAQFLGMDDTLTYGYFNDFFQYAATDWVITTQDS